MTQEDRYWKLRDIVLRQRDALSTTSTQKLESLLATK
jgi:hypothetical protein